MRNLLNYLERKFGDGDYLAVVLVSLALIIIYLGIFCLGTWFCQLIWNYGLVWLVSLCGGTLPQISYLAAMGVVILIRLIRNIFIKS